INNSIKLPDISFPPLLIQPLVENAIKYGLEPKEEGGKISIDCTMDNNHLIIVVADTGRGLDQDANLAGIGINNVSKRLENMFGQNAKLELKQNTPCGLKAVIEVPL
ncbi:MAG: sensor histidine kinase, partial [Desulfobacteraceae bacterium]|nr:sensor histidine kinase [Desulfobacteraceae bacterium]